jgi:hypothetical protein
MASQSSVPWEIMFDCGKFQLTFHLISSSNLEVLSCFRVSNLESYMYYLPTVL